MAAPVSANASLTLAERAGFWSQGVRWLSVAPVALPDVMERRVGQAAHVLIRSLLANDTATDLELLGFVSFSSTTTAGGTVLRDGPWLIYLPPTSGSDPAQDSFTYTARDALGTQVTGTVRIQIAGLPAGGAPNAIGVDHLAGPPALVQVHFLGIAGRAYQVETANDAAGPWVNSGTLTAAADGSMTYSEGDTGGSRFFRIRETP
jgi:Bacterial Ig domain